MDGIFREIYVSNISTIIIAIPVLLLVWSLIGAACYKSMRIAGAILAVIAVVAILYVTVFSRSENGLGTDLVPFSSFSRALTNHEMYRSMLMNVLLFIPLGLSLPFVFGGSTAKRILLTILTGFLLSVTVEAIQYFGSLGMTETDDVICNTLGTVSGSCAYPLSLLWRNLIQKKRKK